MRLFPYPTNPYGPYAAATNPPTRSHRAVQLSARSRTAFTTTLFTPFDISLMADPPPADSPQPDVQDTILPETAMLRDATMFLQWLFAPARIVNPGSNEVFLAERVFW